MKRTFLMFEGSDKIIVLPDYLSFYDTVLKSHEVEYQFIFRYQFGFLFITCADSITN